MIILLSSSSYYCCIVRADDVVVVPCTCGCRGFNVLYAVAGEKSDGFLLVGRRCRCGVDGKPSPRCRRHPTSVDGPPGHPPEGPASFTARSINERHKLIGISQVSRSLEQQPLFTRIPPTAADFAFSQDIHR